VRRARGEQDVEEQARGEVAPQEVARRLRQVEVLEAQRELRPRDGELALAAAARHRRRLADRGPRPRAADADLHRRERPVGQRRAALGVEGAAQHEDHVGRVVEGGVAAVQQLGRDAPDRLHGARDVDAHRMEVVERLEQVEEDDPVGVVVVHPDLLLDDPLLLRHRLRREPRVVDEADQRLEVLLDLLRGREVVRRLRELRPRVAARAERGEAQAHVALLVLEELVLEEMGDPLGDGFAGRAAGGRQPRVERAVVRREHPEAARELGPRVQVERESVRQDALQQRLADRVRDRFELRHASPPPGSSAAAWRAAPSRQ